MKNQLDMDNYDFDSCIGYFEKFVKHTVSGCENVKKESLEKKLQQFLDMTTSAIDKSENSRKRLQPQITENSIEKKTPKIGVDLPNEIWAKIMNYLPTKNIFNSFGLVCKRFYDLTSETRYLEIKGIDYVRHLEESKKKVLILAKTILQLKIDFDEQNGAEVFCEILDVIMACKSNKLKSLIFENLNDGIINFNENLLTLVAYQLSNKIQHLKIVNGHCNSNAITEISKLKHLKSLHMEVDDSGIEKVLELNKFKHLEVLRLKNKPEIQ